MKRNRRFVEPEGRERIPIQTDGAGSERRGIYIFFPKGRWKGLSRHWCPSLSGFGLLEGSAVALRRFICG